MSIRGYTIYDEIGRGGMSVVYRAKRLEDGAPAAIKVFDADTSNHREELMRKFMQEAHILAALEHPNLVKVLDSGMTDDDRPWLAMELIEGAPGNDLPGRDNRHLGGASLAARLSSPHPIAPDTIVRIYADLRAALAYCHEKGIVHGDVKAENVLLAADGTVKLTDFGIARILRSDTRKDIGLSTVTLEGNLGTPYVRAPECQKGEKATAASDVYSFGVILYKLVTGIWYEGSGRLLSQARTFAPDWAPVLARMLAADPAQRFPDAAALPTDPTADARHCRCARRVRTAVLLIAAALLVGLAVWCFATTRRSGEEEPVAAGAPPPAAKFMPSVPPSALSNVPPQKVMSAVQGERTLTDDEWARYFLGTNEYDYVEEATLTRTNRLVLTRPVMYGTLHLPDTNGTVMVESPPGYEGYIVLARRTDGDLFYQMHVIRKGKLRVRASNRAIRVGYRPFPRNPEP